MQPNNPEPFVPIDEVAKHFSVSVSTIRSWVRTNQIPSDTYIKLGNTYRFHLGAITEALLGNAGEEQEPISNLSGAVIEEDIDLDDLADFTLEDDL